MSELCQGWDVPRPSWDTYFLGFAQLASLRSTCLHRHEGAVAVKDHRIIATGYNGAPSGSDHCEIVGCSRKNNNSGERLDICRAVHAEENVLLQCAKHGISCQGATMFCTLQPCLHCAKAIVNAGIKRVVWMDSYPNTDGLDFLRDTVILDRMPFGINFREQFDI